MPSCGNHKVITPSTLVFCFTHAFLHCLPLSVSSDCLQIAVHNTLLLNLLFASLNNFYTLFHTFIFLFFIIYL